ncbi:MAG: hypothetical protein WAK29_02965, partial [Terriglobales bacterium]
EVGFHGFEFRERPLGVGEPAEIVGLALDLLAPPAVAFVGRQREVGVGLLGLEFRGGPLAFVEVGEVLGRSPG